ncbi:hypothetical protein BO71DRAFT_399378 [Aspergillus ellipticus CBS 707.79]|uniref:Uncharacterized protein n=1 Tax=Aspergillus ellipticus CBS 707.79 TaxID=1448320 RepID=A0A319DII7_9EURO|nr:hypothetical protein BO71DRAFT_404574 [Aspergillus ellipticus CBS 707.79]PYH93867.1 hypothetical protein BO71DRAFT_399378 [Aspergillus ellipticus CBS 707.79]
MPHHNGTLTRPVGLGRFPPMVATNTFNQRFSLAGRHLCSDQPTPSVGKTGNEPLEIWS